MGEFDGDTSAEALEAWGRYNNLVSGVENFPSEWAEQDAFTSGYDTAVRSTVERVVGALSRALPLYYYDCDCHVLTKYCEDSHWRVVGESELRALIGSGSLTKDYR